LFVVTNIDQNFTTACYNPQIIVNVVFHLPQPVSSSCLYELHIHNE